MSNKIFLLGDDRNLRPMIERPYEKEDVLQSLLEHYPDLLAGDQMNPIAPRRWLLVKREMGVPDAAEGSGRWSLDHLFLDQEGVLTLVEVKRATDTRARREVVAQMLDYAANAVLYWPVEQIIASFEQTAKEAGRDHDQVLEEFLSGDDEGDAALGAEAFWARVKTNLEAERIRMVFVADIIPRELQRIVEFLNDQMDPAEVMAVEVKQFVGEQVRTLVPRVVGQTVKSSSKAAPRETRNWDRDTFMEQVEAGSGQSAAKTAQLLIDWFESNAAGVRWGTGKQATFTARAVFGGVNTELMRVFANGDVGIGLRGVPEGPLRDGLRDRLLKIEGVHPGGGKDNASTSLGEIATPENWRQFTGAYEWVLESARSLTTPGVQSPT